MKKTIKKLEMIAEVMFIIVMFVITSAKAFADYDINKFDVCELIKYELMSELGDENTDIIENIEVNEVEFGYIITVEFSKDYVDYKGLTVYADMFIEGKITTFEELDDLDFEDGDDLYIIIDGTRCVINEDCDGLSINY